LVLGRKRSFRPDDGKRSWVPAIIRISNSEGCAEEDPGEDPQSGIGSTAKGGLALRQGASCPHVKRLEHQGGPQIVIGRCFRNVRQEKSTGTDRKPIIALSWEVAFNFQVGGGRSTFRREEEN